MSDTRNTRNSWHHRIQAVTVAVATGMLLVACTGSRTVPGDISLVNDPDSVPALDSALMEGAVMNNVATEPETEITAYVQDEIPPAPEMATDRDAAIEQIRTKAAAAPDVKPNVFDRGRSSVQRLTPSEQERLKAELAAIATRNKRAIRSDEAERKAAEIIRLREQAQSHYQDTLDRIED